MAYVPFGPELGAKYTLTGPDGTIAVFNDPTDANYCGVTTEVTGFDSADVRDQGDVLVAADGGYSASNFYGRRPITMTGTMYGYNSIAARNAQMAKIRAATNAMTADGLIIHAGKAIDAIPIGTSFRRQQPLRFSGGWSKTFNISLVSAMAPLVNQTPTTTAYGASVTIENQGDYENLPPLTITVLGATSGTLTITNTTTGGIIKMLAGYTVPATKHLTIYPQQHLTFDENSGLWNTGSLDFVNSTWFGLKRGNNTITTSSGTIQIQYNSSWV